MLESAMPQVVAAASELAPSGRPSAPATASAVGARSAAIPAARVLRRYPSLWGFNFQLILTSELSRTLGAFGAPSHLKCFCSINTCLHAMRAALLAAVAGLTLAAPPVSFCLPRGFGDTVSPICLSWERQGAEFLFAMNCTPDSYPEFSLGWCAFGLSATTPHWWRDRPAQENESEVIVVCKVCYNACFEFS